MRIIITNTYIKISLKFSKYIKKKIKKQTNKKNFKF